MATQLFPHLSRYEQTTMEEDPLLYSKDPWLHCEYVKLVYLWFP